MPGSAGCSSGADWLQHQRIQIQEDKFSKGWRCSCFLSLTVLVTEPCWVSPGAALPNGLFWSLCPLSECAGDVSSSCSAALFPLYTPQTCCTLGFCRCCVCAPWPGRESSTGMVCPIVLARGWGQLCLIYATWKMATKSCHLCKKVVAVGSICCSNP